MIRQVRIPLGKGAQNERFQHCQHGSERRKEPKLPGNKLQQLFSDMESVQERMKRIGAYEKIASFMQKEKQNYQFKRKYAEIRAKEFANECDGRGL